MATVRATKLTEEHKAKIKSSAKKGDKHWNWQGGIASTTYTQRHRLSILEILGFKCVRCGFCDVRALQIDHVNGGGVKERTAKTASHSYYKLILSKILSGSKDYQVLCANCNWIKRVENREGNRKYNG